LSDIKTLTKEQIESIFQDTHEADMENNGQVKDFKIFTAPGIRLVYKENNMKKTDKERLDEALMLMDKMSEALRSAWRFINRVYEDGEELADKVNDVIETYEYTTTKWEDEDEEDKA